MSLERRGVSDCTPGMVSGLEGARSKGPSEGSPCAATRWIEPKARTSTKQTAARTANRLRRTTSMSFQGKPLDDRKGGTSQGRHKPGLCGGPAILRFLAPEGRRDASGDHTTSPWGVPLRPDPGKNHRHVDEKIPFILVLSVLHPPALRQPFFPLWSLPEHSSVVPGQGES